MPRKSYIHDYEKSYARYKENLKNSKNITTRNKEIISAFEKDCNIKEKVALPTRIKYFDVLMYLSKDLKKDLDKFEKKDFEEWIEKVENRKVTISTKQKFRAIIKKFGRWLEYGDKIFNENNNGRNKLYPKTVDWINTNIKRKDMPLIKASDILIEEEVIKIIDQAEHPRDKAFISMLYETGSRIGEIGNLRIKDITEHEHGFLIDLAKGKTGSRNVIIVYHASKLSNWLNQHPLRDNPNAPLWSFLNSDNGNGEQLSYSALKKIVLRATKKSGIKKKVYPHLFRHSRVTHLLNKNELNEMQAKVYFGWTPDSKMLSNYSHLTSKDVNQTMLRIAGIKDQRDEEEAKKVKNCHYCRKPNEPSMKYCGFCGKPLIMETILEIDGVRGRIADLSIGMVRSGKDMEDYFRGLIRSEIKKNK